MQSNHVQWMVGDDLLNDVVLEEPAIHKPSSGEFSITILQQIGIVPMASCNFEQAQPQVIEFSMFSLVFILGIPPQYLVSKFEVIHFGMSFESFLDFLLS